MSIILNNPFITAISYTEQWLCIKVGYASWISTIKQYQYKQNDSFNIQILYHSKPLGQKASLQKDELLTVASL